MKHIKALTVNTSSKVHKYSFNSIVLVYTSRHLIPSIPKSKKQLISNSTRILNNFIWPLFCDHSIYIHLHNNLSPCLCRVYFVIMYYHRFGEHVLTIQLCCGSIQLLNSRPYDLIHMCDYFKSFQYCLSSLL